MYPLGSFRAYPEPTLTAAKSNLPPPRSLPRQALRSRAAAAVVVAGGVVERRERREAHETNRSYTWERCQRGWHTRHAEGGGEATDGTQARAATESLRFTDVLNGVACGK